ncbi:MAG: DUF1476 domain-containing protein [Phycisphaerae bacterium]|nr:DUF1476 domain-containing protein [Phycisphaerae bacterium]
MSGFDDRLKGFEAKYSHDQDVQFRVTARRNRLLGLWAAAKLGLAGDAATEYAATVVKSDFEKPGDDDVIAKVLGDLGTKGIKLDAAAIRAELDKCHHEARKLVAAELR